MVRVLTIVLLLYSIQSVGQSFNKGDYNLFLTTQKLFESNHISFSELRGQVDKRFPQLYFESIDATGNILLQEDIDLLNEQFPKMDQLSELKYSSFLREVSSLMKVRLQNRRTFLATVENQDFFANDSMQVSFKESDEVYEYLEEELEFLWLKQLKLETLSRQYRTVSEDDTPDEQSLDLIFRQIVDTETCKVESLLDEENLKSYVLDNFLKSYTRCFDPHSNYLSVQELRSFTSSLSSEVYSTGLIFSENSGRYLVVEKSPFSSAAKEREISEGDEIISVWTGESFESLACLSFEIIEELFYGFNEKEITIELKGKKDKKIRQFTLAKRIVSTSENHTFTYLLEGDSSRFGYIQFPGFYFDINGISRSSSQDLALILLELKKKEIDGIIIDLRGNGGGSINEASDLAGYFIDYGPLFTLKTPDKPTGTLMKDGKRGKLTDKKVLFLIDGTTASAAELLVSTLKNYPGFLVVGSTTFGKASGYRTIPVIPPGEREARGYAHVTNIQIYQINGFSYQNAGVNPDIKLPSLFSKKLLGEDKLDYSLIKNNIPKKFNPIVSRQEPLVELQKRSSLRVKSSNELKGISDLEKSLTALFDSSFYVSLNYDNFKDPVISNFTEYPKTDTTNYQMISLEEIEAFQKESEDFKSRAMKDPILKEAFFIFEDWLYLSKAK